MRSATFVLAAIAAVAQAQQLMIQTPPSLIECQPAALAFNGGTAPYFLSVLPGGQSTAAPLEQLPQQAAAGTYTWLVDLPAGTSITLQVRDSTGALNYASPVTILAGTSSACINAQASAIAATAPTQAGTAGSSTTTGAAPVQVTPSGLYAYSQSGFAAIPKSASFSQLGSAVSGRPLSYQVVESGASGAVATGVLIAGPSNYVYSVAASGAASAYAEYASCSVSGASAVCQFSGRPQATAAPIQTTFTAPFAQATGLRKMRFARDV